MESTSKRTHTTNHAEALVHAILIADIKEQLQAETDAQ